VSAESAARSEPTLEVQKPRIGAAAVGGRIREHLRNPLNVNVYALTANTIISSLFGIGYWILAARYYSAQQLGVGAAMVSTMTFLSNLAQLNLNGTLARFLPAAGPRGSRLVRYAYGTSCLVAIGISGIFLLIAPIVSKRLEFLDRTPWLAIVFCLSVAAWGVFTLQDSILTALRGVVWVPVENAAYGIAKVVLLVLLAAVTPSLGIFLSWNVAVLAALIPINMLVFWKLLPRLRQRQPAAQLPSRRALGRFVALDYVGFLFLQAGTNALPLLVTARLGAEANGIFYISYLLAGSMELVANHFATSLTVESAADERRLPAFTRQVLRRGYILFLPSVVVMVVFAPLLLKLFGGQYANSGAAVMRLLALAVLPKLIVVVFVATCRVRRRVGRIILTQASMSTLVVSIALVTMDSAGITGVGMAYLAGQSVVAAAVLPSLIKLMRSAPGDADTAQVPAVDFDQTMRLPRIMAAYAPTMDDAVTAEMFLHAVPEPRQITPEAVPGNAVSSD